MHESNDRSTADVPGPGDPDQAGGEQTGREPGGTVEDLVGPTLTVAAVARRLGVAPATLRTWDRRYGLGPSEHAAGAHRRYTGIDLARLMAMRALTLDGVAPSEAARIARTTEPERLPDAVRPVRHLAAVPDPQAPRPAAAGPGPAGPGPGTPDGSGAALAGALRGAASTWPPAAVATPTAVIDAALRGEADEVARLVAPPAAGDLAAWWSDLLLPARAGIAARTVLARPGDEPDALVVTAALSALRDRAGRVPRHPSRRRIVLLLAAPGEQRPLALHVLAGALADAGVDARVVAGPSGRHRLLEIVAMTSPSAVVLTSEQHAPDLDMVAALAQERDGLPVYVMVPEAAAEAVPLGRQVHRVRSFHGLLHEVLAVSGEMPAGRRR